MTYCLCVVLYDLTTITYIESAWFQRLKVKYDKTGFKLYFQFQLAPLHDEGGDYDYASSGALGFNQAPVAVPVPVPVHVPAAPVPSVYAPLVPAVSAAPSRDEILAALTGTWRGDGGGVGRP